MNISSSNKTDSRRSFAFCTWFLLLIAMIGNQAYAAQAITFYHNDMLGSPVATTDEFGNLCWRESYKPYGEKLDNDDGHEPSTAGCGLDDNQVGYTGHVHDKDIGLTYMQARYYDPVVGRFMGIDPVGVVLGVQPTFNRYAYGGNNPYKFVDPDRRESTIITVLDPAGPNHSASYVDNPEGKPTLFDPAARTYSPKDKYEDPVRDPDQNVFQGKHANLNAYVNAYTQAYPKATIVQQHFNTTPEQEKQIADRMVNIDDNKAIFQGLCTYRTVQAIEDIGPFKRGGLLTNGIQSWTIRPEGLMSDLKGLNPSSTDTYDPNNNSTQKVK